MNTLNYFNPSPSPTQAFAHILLRRLRQAKPQSPAAHCFRRLLAARLTSYRGHANISSSPSP